MGCSLLYGAEDPSIAGMVLDSAFSNLYGLMMELVDVYKIRLPKFTVNLSSSYFIIQTWDCGLRKVKGVNVILHSIVLASYKLITSGKVPLESLSFFILRLCLEHALESLFVFVSWLKCTLILVEMCILVQITS